MISLEVFKRDKPYVKTKGLISYGKNKEEHIVQIQLDNVNRAIEQTRKLKDCLNSKDYSHAVPHATKAIKALDTALSLTRYTNTTEKKDPEFPYYMKPKPVKTVEVAEKALKSYRKGLEDHDYDHLLVYARKANASLVNVRQTALTRLNAKIKYPQMPDERPVTLVAPIIKVEMPTLR